MDVQANVTGGKAPGTRARRIPLTLADRLAFGNLTVNEVCALRNRSRSGFYEDVKKGLVSIEKIGDRKSVVRGPVARRYIEGRPIADAALDVPRVEESHADAAAHPSNPRPAPEGRAPSATLARRGRP